MSEGADAAGLRCLVTGGAGFLGSHLCDRLVADGHDVIALDDLSTGSLDNLVQLEGNPRFRFVEHDVREPYDFDVERIYNLACPASPVHYQADPIKTTMTSVLGVYHGLELARRRGARFLQASTSEVYGDPEVHPQPETYNGNVNPIGPRACYDEGKRCAESLCMDYHRVHGVDIRIARIFNTYGPRMAVNDGRVVSNFIVQALRGEPLTIYGDGTQTRSLCYVDDMIEGLVRLMGSQVGAAPCNLGSDDELGIREIAVAVETATGAQVGLALSSLPEDDPRLRRPDLRLAGERLAYGARTDVSVGLARTLDWYRGRT